MKTKKEDASTAPRERGIQEKKKVLTADGLREIVKKSKKGLREIIKKSEKTKTRTPFYEAPFFESDDSAESIVVIVTVLIGVIGLLSAIICNPTSFGMNIIN